MNCYDTYHLTVNGCTVELSHGHEDLSQATIDYFRLDEWLAHQRRMAALFDDGPTPDLRATHGKNGIPALEAAQ